MRLVAAAKSRRRPFTIMEQSCARPVPRAGPAATSSDLAVGPPSCSAAVSSAQEYEKPPHLVRGISRPALSAQPVGNSEQVAGERGAA